LNRPDPGKKKNKVGILKQNNVLITQLFLSLQSRPDADVAEFFKYENQKEPPALSERGSLRGGTKSDILKCINASTGRAHSVEQATVLVFDMAAVIHMVTPTRATTFDEYVSLHIVPFLKSQMTTAVQRIDAIWDTYPEQNLKSLTQQRRGSGTRTLLKPDGDGNTPVPKRGWQSYLKNVENKQELFSFISRQLTRQILTENSSSAQSLRRYSPTNHSVCQKSSHAIMQKQIVALSCILRMPRLKATTKHLFSQLTVISLFLPSPLIVLACHSYGLALALANTTETLQFTASTRSSAHQDHELYLCFMP